jgi:ribosomal protein S21
MIQVSINNQNDFEKEFKKFMQRVEKDGILSLVINRRYYSKPSELKRKRKK